jgi:hypothetical protein
MTTEDAGVRGQSGLRTPPSVRILLRVTMVVLLVVGVLLFFLPERTDELFAWTVGPPLMAAFMGASYLASAALIGLSARQPWWVQARLSLVTSWVFLVTMEIVTLVHIDRFHFDPALPLLARMAAWVWLALYTAVPVWIVVVVILALRRRVQDPPPRWPLPVWFRGILVLYGALVAVVAGVFLFAPEPAAEMWPWALTPLTARTVGSWMLPTAVLAIHAAVENDLDRLLPVAVTWTLGGVLQPVAVVRYLDDFDATGSTLYLGYVAPLAVFGVVTLWLRRRAKLAPQVSAGP